MGRAQYSVFDRDRAEFGALALGPLPAWAQGWYLLVPPLNEADQADSSRPLKEWEQTAAFHSANACERARRAKQRDVEAKWKEEEKAALARQQYEEFISAGKIMVRWWQSRCVSANDPRLR